MTWEHVFEIKHLRPVAGKTEPEIAGFERKIISEYIGEDAIMNQGRRQSVLLLLGSTAQGTAWWRHIAIGTNVAAPAATQTTLIGEITGDGGQRSLGTKTQLAGTLQLHNTFAFTASYAVQESGVFNKASGGSMLARGTFAVKNVASGDSLQVTHKIRLQ